MGDKADPWDHVESAMGLVIGGRTEAARAAYEWLRQQQLDDGSEDPSAAHADALAARAGLPEESYDDRRPADAAGCCEGD